MTKTKQDIQSLRGPLNALIVRSMRRDDIKEVTKWADHWNIGRSTMYNLLRGRETTSGTWVTPSVETLIKLARAFQMPLHEIIYLIEPDAPGAELVRSQAQGAVQPSVGVRELPVQVAGWCGAGPDQHEEVLGEHVCVEQSFVRDRDLVAFKIRGDSMEAGKNPIYSGDTVLIDRADKGYDTASVVARLVSGRLRLQNPQGRQVRRQPRVSQPELHERHPALHPPHRYCRDHRARGAYHPRRHSYTLYIGCSHTS